MRVLHPLRLLLCALLSLLRAPQRVRRGYAEAARVQREPGSRSARRFSSRHRHISHISSAARSVEVDAKVRRERWLLLAAPVNHSKHFDLELELWITRKLPISARRSAATPVLAAAAAASAATGSSMAAALRSRSPTRFSRLSGRATPDEEALTAEQADVSLWGRYTSRCRLRYSVRSLPAPPLLHAACPSPAPPRTAWHRTHTSHPHTCTHLALSPFTGPEDPGSRGGAAAGACRRRPPRRPPGAAAPQPRRGANRLAGHLCAVLLPGHRRPAVWLRHR